MKQFKNILFVINESDDIDRHPVLSLAVQLAKRNGSRLTLMSVVALPKRLLSTYHDFSKPDEIIDLMTKERQIVLGQLAEQIDITIDTRIEIRVGRDFMEIVRQVLVEKHDLVIKLANEHSNSFDSNDFHLMRKCPKPVWLIRRTQSEIPKKLLAAVDVSMESDPQGQALNGFIMDLATSLAAWQGYELHLISCWSLPGEDALRYSGFLKRSEAEIHAMLNEEEQASRDRQHNLLNRHSTQKIHPHLLKGSPDELIPALVEKEKIDTVVMGTVGRSGIPGLLIGNTAETVLNRIKASVITLKPEGFESPIDLSEERDIRDHR